MRALVVAALLLGVVAASVLAASPPTSLPARAAQTSPPPSFADYPFTPRPCDHAIRFRRSRARGRPFAGWLERGVRLPRFGCDHFSWQPVLERRPNGFGRLWGTDYLIRKVLRVLKRFHEAHPDAPRIGIGDISRRYGGIFDERFGGLGHDSHQNGRDVDVHYPRNDGLEQSAQRPAEVDRRLSQDLVRLFLRAHVQYIFVGPHVGLEGPPRIVQPLRLHDDHMHIRVYARRTKPRR